ncbi:SIS domain-containing protein [Amycolatopsis aidingensis]|uniref:SIS domain-containing protein n=1 Tax=Amycolatopsis aidingensis TaxID=2842453 RepID=UPI001C0C89BA|nr:SIS domain-containing protein [Amycolatopsis aidingensis]
MSRSFMEEEIASQPGCWRRAVELAGTAVALPRPGRRVAVVGCGTSRFIAESYAVLRESAGHGHTDAFAASEFPRGRSYDELVAITRSGTTTEVLRLLAEVRGRIPTTVITGVPTEVAGRADTVVDLSFADERSVVQTRFATSTLALLRAQLGERLDRAIAEARGVLETPIPGYLRTAGQFTFLGTGWTVGLANEAALKFREASLAWAESYPAWEYRHGPISISEPGRVTWMFGEPPAGLPADVRRAGGTFEASSLDPQAELVRAQLAAAALAGDRGLDPDRPRSLTRSVVLH